MRIALAVLLLLALPRFVAAEAVTVRAGEHADFTRVVLDLPRAVTWTLEGEEELTLSLSDMRPTFETSSAMQKLSSGRVTGVRSVAGKLVISLGCECRSRSFMAGTSMLVIDLSGDPESTAVASRAQKQTPQAEEQPANTALSASGRTEFALPIVIPRRGHVAPAPRSSQKMSSSEIDRIQAATIAREKALKQLARASTQGLVRPIERPQRKPQPAKKPVQKSEENLEKKLEAKPSSNIRVISSADRDFFAARTSGRGAADRSSCMPDPELDVASWIGDGDFQKVIGEGRRKLYVEFDGAAENAALTLAKAYIAFGFGLEAVSVLEEAEPGAPIDHLRAMATLVDDGNIADVVPTAWRLDCDGAAALWALAAGAPIGPGTDIDRAAIRRSFSEMPPVLRKQIAPRLIGNLRGDETGSLAQEIARVAERGTDVQSDAVVLAQAEVAPIEATETLDLLREVVMKNGVEAPEALVRLIDLSIENKFQVSEDLLDLADAYAKEFGKEPLGAALKRVHIMAEVSKGKFEAPFRKLGEITPRLGREESERAANYVMDRLTAHGDDIVFLANTHDALPASVKLAVSAENAVAERLIELGFADRALAFLSGAAQGALGRDRKLLRAQAALKLSRPRQASAELLGLSGPDIEQLRIKARIMSEDYRGARIALETLGDEAAASEQAFLDEDWTALHALTSSEWQSETALSEVETVGSPAETSLEASTAALENSEMLRDLIEAVLSRHEVQATLPGTY